MQENKHVAKKAQINKQTNKQAGEMDEREHHIREIQKIHPYVEETDNREEMYWGEMQQIMDGPNLRNPNANARIKEKEITQTRKWRNLDIAYVNYNAHMTS